MPLIERLSNPSETCATAPPPSDIVECGDPLLRPILRKVQGRRLAAVEVDELVALYKSGDETNDLATHFGIHRSTVRLHLRRRGVPLRPGFDGEALTEARRLYDAGMSLNEVARQTGWDPATIGRHFRTSGLTLR